MFFSVDVPTSKHVRYPQMAHLFGGNAAGFCQTRMGCKFVWGEVKEINGEQKTATYQPIFAKNREAW